MAVSYFLLIAAIANFGLSIYGYFFVQEVGGWLGPLVLCSGMLLLLAAPNAPKLPTRISSKRASWLEFIVLAIGFVLVSIHILWPSEEGAFQIPTEHSFITYAFARGSMVVALTFTAWSVVALLGPPHNQSLQRTPKPLRGLGSLRGLWPLRRR